MSTPHAVYDALRAATESLTGFTEAPGLASASLRRQAAVSGWFVILWDGGTATQAPDGSDVGVDEAEVAIILSVEIGRPGDYTTGIGAALDKVQSLRVGLDQDDTLAAVGAHAAFGSYEIAAASDRFLEVSVIFTVRHSVSYA